VLVRRIDGCHGTGIHLRTIMSQFLGKPEADVDADDAEQLFDAMTEREWPNERLVLIIDDAERLGPEPRQANRKERIGRRIKTQRTNRRIGVLRPLERLSWRGD
jgi:hypothetical protein